MGVLFFIPSDVYFSIYKTIGYIIALSFLFIFYIIIATKLAESHKNYIIFIDRKQVLKGFSL